MIPGTPRSEGLEEDVRNGTVMRLPPFHWWRTVFFLIPAISVYTIGLGIVSLVSSLFDRRGNTGHRCARAWGWLILATTGVGVRRTGVERLDRRRSYVFVSNHQSIYDIPIVFASMPFQLRILAKQSLGHFPFLGWHLRRTGHILIDRSRPGTALFKRVSAVLGDAASLIVFPEGTRSVDGRVGRFKGGLFYLAIEAGLPIVPLSIRGSRHVMRKGRLMTCPGQVDLTVHNPIETRDLAPEDAKSLAARVRAVVESAVTETTGTGAEPPLAAAVSMPS